MKTFSTSALLLFAVAVAVLFSAAAAVESASSKIPQSLRTKSVASANKANVFVVLQGTKHVLQGLFQVSQQPSTSLQSRAASVRSALEANAQESQRAVLAFLKDKSSLYSHVESFWITNQVYIRGAEFELLELLAERDDVERITEEPTLDIRKFLWERTEVERRSHGASATIMADWGIERMRVPEVWARGFNGSGLIVANIDTGVRGTHELLRDKWVGPMGGWFDPENKTADPHDVYNHGTHTMGTLVGGDGIGAAPGARWTACKGYKDDGFAEASTFIACAQFMLCPTDTSGANPDCSKTPAVVSNSWGWSPGETAFNGAIEAWNAAGILSSFSAGNTGLEGCSTTYSPADQPPAIAIGATDSFSTLALWSSRGPGAGGRMKPEISAPGVGIYSASAQSDTAYMTASGTSMSCPSASGVLVLLKNADPSLTSERLVGLLEETADKGVVPQGQSCGGVTDSVIPNNHFGHGVVDAAAALEALLPLSP